MLYNGRPVTLTKQQEEVATFFAVMKDTDYAEKPQFVKNFFEGFREVLGKNHVIQQFEKCDFEPIHQWHLGEKAKKAALTKEVNNQRALILPCLPVLCPCISTGSTLGVCYYSHILVCFWS